MKSLKEIQVMFQAQAQFFTALPNGILLDDKSNSQIRVIKKNNPMKQLSNSIS